MTKIKTSLVISVWGTEHLLKRTMETYAKQTLPKDEWELIIVSDNALGNVEEIIAPYWDKINLQFIKLVHPFGMRGNTISFNTAIQSMRGEIYAESTPEIMMIPEALELLTNPHFERPNEKLFVALKNYRLTKELQLAIDTVDWREDLNNIKNLEGFNNDWTLNNTKEQYREFNGHETCSMRLKNFLSLNNNLGWWKYCDYGSEDCTQSGKREQQGGWVNVTENRLDKYCFHQHHLPFNFFTSLGHAPMLNKNNHTMENYMNDTSGEVPPNGSSKIWDGGSTEKMSAEEAATWREHDAYFLESGGDPKYLIPRA